MPVRASWKLAPRQRPKPFRWLRSHPKLSTAAFLLLAFLALNVVAYRHAYAMTHFVPAGVKPKNPEAMSFFEKAHALCAGVQIPRPANTTAPDALGLPFDVHRFVGREGIELEAWHIPHPDARALVLMFHGYASSKAGLLREAKAFHELGYAVFLPDFPGSGGSGGDATTVGMAEAEDVVRTWEYARAAWPGRPVILFGQSMGSAAVLRAVAVRGLDPRAVVVECPFDTMLSTVANRFSAMGLPAFPGAHLLVFWGGAQQGFNGFAHNPVEYAKAVRCPVLLLHGETDPRVTRGQAEAIFQNFAGPKRFELFAALGHESYVAAKPGQWKRAVEAFLK